MCYKCNTDCNDSCPQVTPPCYEDCGCPIEVTFECVTYTGPDFTNIELGDDKTGDAILAAIDVALGQIKAKEGKVAVDADDICPANLFDKLEQGNNIAISVVGTGCDRKLRIDNSTGSVIPDIKAKVSANDNTSDYLFNKFVNSTFIEKVLSNPGGNETLRFDLKVSELVSKDSGNQITIGNDGRLKTSYTAPDGSETIIREGTGIKVTGTGTTNDPYVLSTNASIQAAKTCFDGTWRVLTIATTNNSNVANISSGVFYRYRFDGSIEFKGNATYSINFGPYSSGNRKFTIPFSTLPVNCITSGEQAGTFDLKGVNYIDVPQTGVDQIVQQYGYIIRKSAQNLILEFQSSFNNTTSKTIVVSFDGVVSHPSF